MRKREVPEERIKKLIMAKSIEDTTHLSEHQLKVLVIQDMAREIAVKLMEFNKVVIERSDNWCYYNAEIEVIIPPTPGENLDAQPGPTCRLTNPKDSPDGRLGDG